MTKYFENFPIVSYKGTRIRDITRRNKISNNSLTNPYVILSYTVKEGEKPEDIAYYYYGSTDYVWVVYLSNNILDPYYEWPLSENDFNEFIINKYASQSGQVGYDVIAWAQNENGQDNKILDRGTEYTVYEYERILNENKREILLIDRKFISELEKDFVRLVRNE